MSLSSADRIRLREAVDAQVRLRLAAGICAGIDTNCKTHAEHAPDADGCCLWCGKPVSRCEKWTREEAIEALQQWVYRHGSPPRRAEMPGTGLPSSTAYCRLFGSLSAYVLAACYGPRRDHPLS